MNELMQCSKQNIYSIASSARASAAMAHSEAAQIRRAVLLRLAQAESTERW